MPQAGLSTIMSAMHCHGTLTAVRLIGLIEPLSSASLVFFRKARQFLISAVAAVRPLRFTSLRRAFASRAWTVPRRSSRYAEPECPIKSGSPAICGPWHSVGDLTGCSPGIASFIFGTKISGPCLAHLPRMQPLALFSCSMPALVMARPWARIKAIPSITQASMRWNTRPCWRTSVSSSSSIRSMTSQRAVESSGWLGELSEGADL
jgi:hypothetical protein